MKFLKYSLMAFAFAAVFTACSDEDDYAAGANSPGAYFAATSPKTVAVSAEATTVEIPVYRTSADAPAVYNLTVEDESGLFTFPSQVTFEGNSTEAKIVVTYDPTKLVIDVPYPVTVSFPTDGSAYGMTTYSLNFMIPSPVIELPSTTADYTYTFYWEGVDTDLEVKISYIEGNEAVKTYCLVDWGLRGEAGLTIIVDENVQYAPGIYKATVPCQYIGQDHSTYGPVWVADVPTYANEVLNRPDIAASYEGTSYFNSETGLFTLDLGYYVPEYGDGTSWFGDGEEFAQLAGYPDFTVALEYKGVFSTPDGDLSAVFNVDVAADVEEAKLAVGATDPQAVLDGILDGTIDCTTLKAGEQQTVYVPVDGPGEYSAVIVSYGFGEAQTFDYTTFTISGGMGNDKADWTDLGECDIVESWVTPSFSFSDTGLQVNPYDFQYALKVQQNKENPGIIRLVEPYGEEYPLGSLNKGDGKGYMVIDISNPQCVQIAPQFCGWVSNNEQFIEGNLSGYWVSVQGIDPEQIIAAGRNDVMEDGVIIIDQPTHQGKDGFRYYYLKQGTTDECYPSEIYLPIAGQAARAKAISKKKVSRQAVRFNNAIKSMRGMQRIAVKFNEQKAKPVSLYKR